MAVINQLCSTGDVKNPCKKVQKLPKNIIGYILAKKGQSFASVDAVTDASLKTEIQNKKLTPSYELAGDLEQNFENGITQTPTRDYRGALTQYRATASHKLSVSQQSVVTSYEDNFSNVYFYSSDGELFCTVDDSGVVKGIPLASIIPGLNPLPSGDVNSQVFMQFKSFEASLLIPSIDFDDVEGIYDLDLTVVSASATEIIFKAQACCDDLETLESADLTLLATDGTAQAIGGLTYANGTYTLTGTGLTSGTLSTAGVIDKTEFLTEGSVAITI